MSIGSGAIIKGVVECTQGHGGLMVNVFYWQTTFADPEDEATVTDDLMTELNIIMGAIDQYQHEDVSYDIYRFYEWVGLPDGWNLIGTEDPGLTPTLVDEMMPTGCAFVIRAYTSVSRRMGRKYLGGFTEANFSGQDWSSALQTSGGGFASNWMGGADPAVGRSYAAGVFHDAGGFTGFIGTAVINAIPGYQRRRKEGVGA